MSYHKQKIVEYGRVVASNEPDSPALKHARDWWKAGAKCRYSNEDFDIMQSLLSVACKYGAK